jgi:hypothetical protein
MKNNDMRILELTDEEAKLIFGGDEAMYGIGYYIGKVGRWLSSISYPSEAYANAMSMRGI